MNTQTRSFPVPRSTASVDEMAGWTGPATRSGPPEQRGRRAAAEAAQGLGESAVRRGVAAIGLAGIALIHLLDLPGKVQETPYLAVGYVGLIGAALLAAEVLVRRDSTPAWLATLGLTLSTVAGFVATRTVGLPGATDDIGNWLEPLGLASLFVEGVVAALAVLGLARRR